MRAILFGKGGERFLPLPPPKRRIWGGDLWGDALGEPLVGSSEGKKGRMGEERPERAQDIGLVAPSRMAR